MSEGKCDGCQRRALLTPLHGAEKGGPLRCYVCAGTWHAEHGRRRKMGRVVIRAIKAYVDGGGSWDDVRKLKDTALMGGDTFSLLETLDLRPVVDPLGYMAETAATAGETVLLTSELLADALRLVHPDAHPPERRELATRVTQQLLALQPFVFPAETPKPTTPSDPAKYGSFKSRRETLKEPSRDHGPRYPCADCASTVPYYYCAPCRAEWDKRREKERELERAKQHAWYKMRKARRAMGVRPTPCAACGAAIKGKRKDARFCSVARRQRAHRKDVTDKNNCAARLQNNRDIQQALS
jgi:hypothetical protein